MSSNIITVIFGTSAAAAKAVEWDKSMIIGDGSPALSATTIYLLLSTTWQTQLEDAGFSDTDQLYLSVGNFFAASPTPEEVYAVGYVAGATTNYLDIPLIQIDEEVWEHLKSKKGIGDSFNDVLREELGIQKIKNKK